jgi:hypothetical protein
VYDRAVINAILDEALVCHVGFVDQDQPFVIPTIHVRIDDRLYLHGSAASRLLRCLAAGAPACITVTLLDGLVLARSAFHHSMNYRSVVVLGTADMVTDPDDKLEALRALTEHVVPSRWADARKPTSIELKGTTVLSLPINEASAKIRSGPPGDDEPDYDLPIWAGVIPLSLHAGAPESDPNLAAGIDTPEYAAHYRRS